MISEELKEIIETLKTTLGYYARQITQEEFDSMVEYVIKTEEDEHGAKELLWRFCGSYEGLNFNKVIDLYVDTLDDYYISELVCYIDGNLDQEYLTTKMLNTKDKNFIKLSLSNCGNAMEYSLDEEYITKLKEFIND